MVKGLGASADLRRIELRAHDVLVRDEERAHRLVHAVRLEHRLDDGEGLEAALPLGRVELREEELRDRACCRREGTAVVGLRGGRLKVSGTCAGDGTWRRRGWMGVMTG